MPKWVPICTLRGKFAKICFLLTIWPPPFFLVFSLNHPFFREESVTERPLVLSCCPNSLFTSQVEFPPPMGNNNAWMPFSSPADNAVLLAVYSSWTSWFSCPPYWEPGPSDCQSTPSSELVFIKRKGEKSLAGKN